MFVIWVVTTNSIIYIELGVRMSKKSTYTGGEEDKQKDIVPKRLERFFNKKVFFIILTIVFLLLLQLLSGL